MKKNILDLVDSSAVTSRDLEELESFLRFESKLKHPMNLETLDGYLTALVVGPDIVRPKAWLPFVWDSSGEGETPEFHSPEQAEHIIGIIMRLMNSIVLQLDEYSDEYLPLPDMSDYGADKVKRHAVRMWCLGFLMDVSVRESSWAPLLRDKKASAYPTLISIVAGLFRESLQIDEEKEFEYWASVPGAVLDIQEFWMPYHDRQMELLKKHENRAPKRNEECPCGSGRKYKKCCGKQA